MAKKVDIDKKDIIKMLSPEKFNMEVKTLADKMPIMAVSYTHLTLPTNREV